MTDEREEFRPVPSLKHRYGVSQTGRVKNLMTGRIMTPSRLPSGYLQFTVTVDKQARKALGHLLSLEAWHGPRPSPNHRPIFKNGKRDEIAPDCLEWGGGEPTIPAPRGSGARLGEYERAQAVRLAEKHAVRVVATLLGCAQSTVRNVLRDHYREEGKE